MTTKYSLLLLFFLPQVAWSTAYYMSPTGSDTNSGTSTSKPWKTLDRLQVAQSILKAGDVVYFRGGNYVIKDTTVRDYYSWKGGTTSAPIKYMRYLSETPVIVGDRRTKSPGMLIYLQSYVTVDGLSFTETSGQRLAGGHGDDPNKRSNGKDWTPLASWATGVVVRNVSITGWMVGMYYQGDKLLFERNKVMNTRSHRLYIAGKNGIFRNNTLGGSYGYFNQQGFQVQYETAIGNKIYNNIISEGMATGFVLSGKVSYNQIYNNVFINPGNKLASVTGGGSMIGLWCEDGPMGVGNKVYNNTFMGKTKSAMMSDPLITKCGTTRPAAKVEIRDNIFYPAKALLSGLTKSYSNINNNILYNLSGTAPSGNITGKNPLLVNPLGLTAASAMLKIGSPATNKGKSALFPPGDYNGRKRPQGGIYDLGAFEF